MNLIRRLGMYLSLTLISVMHFVQYWVNIMRGEVETHGVRVILVRDRQVVLVSHWYAPWAWTLPGGGVSKGESAEECAMREAREETGFNVNSIAGEVGTYEGSMGDRDKVTVYYTGDFDGSLALRPNLEIMARSWFDIDNLPHEISPANRRRIEAYRDGIREERKRW